MQLDFLIDELTGLSPLANSDRQIDIKGITTDPNLCRPGFLYLAAESESVDSTKLGMRLDGRDFILTALKNDATVILSSNDVVLPDDFANDAVLVTHETPLSLLGPICARFYGKQPSTIALVTGTNGKTSTVNFSRMLWAEAGLPACSIGNLGGVCSDGSLVWPRDRTLSVPDTVTMHQVLKDVAERGINHLAMEATSHALFDYRLSGVKASIGAFTNLTRDHLDFHHTLDEYFRVKMTLFSDVLPANSSAVLNADDLWFGKALEICQRRGHRIFSFGRQASEIQLLKCIDQVDGQLLQLNIFGKKYECKLNLMGFFQASNALCSLGIAIASGVSVDLAVKNIELLTPIEGRLNTVAHTASGGRVVVDFAHTPDGIRAALEACRTFTRGRLITVFGCDGERDQGKRPEMGEMARKLADLVIVTDGDPSSEDAAAIRRDVIAGAPGACEIANRVSAIEFAVHELVEGDTLLVTGRFPVADGEIARKSALLAVKSPGSGKNRDIGS